MKPRLAPVLREPLRLLYPFWKLAVFATLAGMASGLATAALIATINRSLHEPGGALLALVLTFLGLALLALAGELAGNIGNGLVGQRIIANLRLELCHKILGAPLAQIERYKPHRLLAALDRDVSTIGLLTFNLSSVIIAVAITFGGFVYLASLSWPLFFIALAAVAVNVAVQYRASRVGSRHFDTVRSAYDDLQKQYRAIIEGAKELRLNRVRRERLFAHRLTPAVERIRDNFIRAIKTFFAGKALSSAVFFAVLLAVILAGFAMQSEPAVLSGFVIVLLFVRGPTEQIIAALPLFADARVSLRRLGEMAAAFANELESLPAASPRARLAHRTIEMRAVKYAFPPEDTGKSFVLGPIDLTVDPGELLLITGENGSGKTTLIKLLVGLYEPTAGDIRCDGVAIEPSIRDDYRQLFSAIFFDYHLFADFAAPDRVDRDEIGTYLNALKIADKVDVGDDGFSTIDLSTGQRKRLALIHALIEDRPIIVLDEWAADQDPVYRTIFYREILPALKAKGKTLIVVSHDDRYFDIGDRVITMRGGRICSSQHENVCQPASDTSGTSVAD